MSDDRDDDMEDDAPPRGRFSRLGEQLTGLLDPESAFRRGQNMVTGMTNATKDEFMRIVSAEVRSFLDKMDAADLIQQVIAGLVVDVNMQVRFSRDDPDAPAQPHITKSETKIGVRSDADREAARERERERVRERDRARDRDKPRERDRARERDGARDDGDGDGDSDD